MDNFVKAYEKYSIEIESDNKEELIALIQALGVTNFEIRPFIDVKKNKFILSNTLSESDWDILSQLVSKNKNVNTRFKRGTELKKRNKRKIDPKKVLRNVGKGNRFAKSKNTIPDIFGNDSHPASKYLNILESNQVISNLSKMFPNFVKVLSKEFPHTTINKRTFKAVHISSNFNKAKPVVMLIAGLHSREWMPQDALIYLISDILQAQAQQLDLKYGNFILNSNSIFSILNKIDIVVLPCANPDGRYYSQTFFPDQRKNMNLTEAEDVTDISSTNHGGVDINRNFDIGWDFKKLYKNDNNYAHIGASENPTAQSYYGNSAESENETKNLVWLLDHFKTTSWLIDCHSYANKVLVPWGLEENQFTDPKKNINNHVHDSLRGALKDPEKSSYKEYMYEPDHQYMLQMADSIAVSTKQAFGETNFKVVDASGFGGGYYTGVLPDYAYSRHKVDSNNSKIFALTLESGNNLINGFQPSVRVALKTKKEICAGILGLLEKIVSDI